MGNNRRERSRSPMRIDNGGRRRDIKPDISKSNESSMPVMNPIMMANMYPQGKQFIHRPYLDFGFKKKKLILLCCS